MGIGGVHGLFSAGSSADSRMEWSFGTTLGRGWSGFDCNSTCGDFKLGMFADTVMTVNGSDLTLPLLGCPKRGKKA